MVSFLSDSELRELSKVYHRGNIASSLLRRAGIARNVQPVFDSTSLDFWRAVDESLADGRVGPEVAGRILALAREEYPGNPVFAGAGGGTPRPRSDSQSSGAFPVMGAIIVVDAVGFSKNGALIHLEWRQGLRAVTARALAATPIPAELVHFNDRGDGFMAVVDGQIPVYTVAADFVRELETTLGEYNRGRNDLGRVRLRIALHQGQVFVDGTGLSGTPAIDAARLVDAPQVRAVLRQHPELHSALIVSDLLFRSTVVERFRGLAPEDFDRVDVHMEKYEGVAWLRREATVGSGPAGSGPADGSGVVSTPVPNGLRPGGG
ncbi:hypothetical protein UG55_101152 [Frankia sp. EI5c]|nr:hypothetical protein UG55_101152 [Frankia sp. EI5c]